VANFVRDGIALDIPEAQLSLLKSCFDKADNELIRLQDKINDFAEVIVGEKKYLADSQVASEFKLTLSKLEAVTKDCADLKLEAKAKTEEVESLKIQLDSLSAKSEALELELQGLKSNNSNEAFEKRLSERRDLERVVFRLLDQDESELVNLSDRQLKEALIVKRYNYDTASLATKTDDAISAIFEVASMESTKDSAKGKTNFPQIKSLEATNYDVAIAEYVKDIENAYKTGLKGA
jgi:hypothetical protein